MLRTAFYPCCGMDIKFPVKLLSERISDFYFCDIWLDKFKKSRKFPKNLDTNIQLHFLNDNVWDAVLNLPQIDILFYRRDGMSEGGSGVEILFDEFLSLLLKKFPDQGGTIITDGSNASRDYRYDLMLEGEIKINRFHITKSKSQLFKKFNLFEFDVRPSS